MVFSDLIGVATSKNNVTIRLTRERWLHITTAHPEIKASDSLTALDIVENPNIVLSVCKY